MDQTIVRVVFERPFQTASSVRKKIKTGQCLTEKGAGTWEPHSHT